VFIIIFVLSLNNYNCLLNTVGSDFIHISSSPSRWERCDYAKFTGVIASVGALMLLDDEIRNEVQNYNGNVNNIVDALEPFGSTFGIGLLGGGILIGHLSDNDELKRLSLRASESALISTGITYLIKMGTGRKRPDLEEGPYKWTGPTIESGMMSMPSGHTAFAFAVASYLSSETDNPLIDILSYTCAIMVGYARIKNDKHWASDVYLGALIGISVGRTISILD